MYFAGGNCLDGDSDAFHFIGYAESTDKLHWTVYYDADHPSRRSTRSRPRTSPTGRW
jgi:hypothetical protein